MNKYFVGFILFFTTFVFAQEQEIEGVTIIKKNKKKEQKAFTENAQATTILTKKELNRNNSVLLEKTLGTVAGVQVENRTTIGGQRIILRGYGNDQRFNNWGVKMYLNGVPLTSADGTTILEDVDFSQLTSVEVIKGAAGTKFGGGVGGVVQFLMQPNRQKGTSVSEKMTLGSFHHFQNQLKLESVTDKSAIALHYNHLESDGFRPRGKSLKNNYAFLGDFTLNEKQDLEVYVAHNNSYEEVSGQISYQDYEAGIDPGNSAYIDRGSGNKIISNRGSVRHHWEILEGLENSTSVFFGYLDSKRIASGAYEKSSNINYGLRSVFNFDKKINDKWNTKTEFGVEYLTSKSQISNYRFTKSATNLLQVKPIKKASYFDNQNINFSIFAIENITYQPWNLRLLLGMSANHTKYEREDLLALEGLVKGYDKNLSFKKEYKTTFTPHIALQKKWKNQIFNLSYSEGYNSPTAKTSIGNESSATEVNDYLKVEKAKMWDFSMQGLLFNERLDYQISLFSMKIKDKLTSIKTADYSYFINGGTQLNKGLEMSAGYTYQNFSFLKNIRPFFTYSYYDFNYQKLNIASVNNSGKRVVGVPKNKYTLGVDLETKFGVYMNHTFNYLGDVYSDFGNTNLVKGFGLYHVKMGYQKNIGKFNFDVFVIGNNLTNQINYTFLFSGNSQKNGDDNSNYANVQTDITPGYLKASFFYGFNVKYEF